MTNVLKNAERTQLGESLAGRTSLVLMGWELPPLRIAAIVVAVAVVNTWLCVMAISEMNKALDWGIMQRAALLAGDRALYAPRGTWTYVWSPVAAYPLQLLVPIGLAVWRILTLGFALAMPTWRLRLLVLISGPFWIDIATGNILTLILLMAVWALRGSKLATVSFFVIALLIPRPLLAPIVVWLLWRRPEWRLPFAVLFGIHAVLVWMSGLGPEWISTTLAVGPEIQANTWNMGPTRWLGWWWMLLGVPLAVWLTWRGRLGWAGLVGSPYIWPYYLMFALLGFDSASWRRTDSRSPSD